MPSTALPNPRPTRPAIDWILDPIASLMVPVFWILIVVAVTALIVSLKSNPGEPFFKLAPVSGGLSLVAGIVWFLAIA